MKRLVVTLRRVRLQWRLKSLDEQAHGIMAARHDALMRLLQIRRERDALQAQLAVFPPEGIRRHREQQAAVPRTKDF